MVSGGEVHVEDRRKSPIQRAVVLVIATGLICLSRTASAKLIDIALDQDCSCTDHAREKRPDLAEICTRNAAEWGAQATEAGYPVDATPSADDLHNQIATVKRLLNTARGL